MPSLADMFGSLLGRTPQPNTAGQPLQTSNNVYRYDPKTMKIVDGQGKPVDPQGLQENMAMMPPAERQQAQIALNQYLKSQ
jgi:hypothetical protein